jgi:hypothetical protein
MDGMTYDPDGLGKVMRRQTETQADFTYSMAGNVISIVDLDQGNRSVTNDVENVLRKIEHYHQGSIAGFRIMYRDSMGFWDGIQWDGQDACSFPCAKQRKHKRGSSS